MYIDISSVDQLMKSTIENKLFLNNRDSKRCIGSFYVLEKAATEMLDSIKHKKVKPGDILEKAANLMLAHLKNSKQEYVEQKNICFVSQ